MDKHYPGSFAHPGTLGSVRALMRDSRGRIAVVILAALSELGLAGVSKAADSSTALMLVAYSNVFAGRAIVSGDYDAALKALQQPRPAEAADRFNFDTNRCVAFTATRQLPDARVACDEAVRDARSVGLAFSVSARNPTPSDKALAFSNRAVLEWLAGDRAAAERDLMKARSLDPAADFVAHNLTAFRNRVEAGLSARTPPIAGEIRADHP